MVNCVDWHPQDTLLYSGSDDTQIVEWDLQTGKSRWSVTTYYTHNLHFLEQLAPFIYQSTTFDVGWDRNYPFLKKENSWHLPAVFFECLASTRPFLNNAEQCIDAHSLPIVHSDLGHSYEQ